MWGRIRRYFFRVRLDGTWGLPSIKKKFFLKIVNPTSERNNLCKYKKKTKKFRTSYGNILGL